MFSPKTSVLAIATALVATAGVQADYFIVPDTVPLSTRQNWCTSELQQCPYICRDMGASGASVNTCNATTLNYGCLCTDGTRPNTSEYSLTLPYFTCVEYVRQCIAACNSATECEGACQSNNPCGATDPKQYNATSTATTSSASSTSTDDSSTIYGSGANGGIGGSNSSAAGPPAFELARLYATGASLGLFALGFMYML